MSTDQTTSLVTWTRCGQRMTRRSSLAIGTLSAPHGAAGWLGSCFAVAPCCHQAGRHLLAAVRFARELVTERNGSSARQRSQIRLICQSRKARWRSGPHRTGITCAHGKAANRADPSPPRRRCAGAVAVGVFAGRGARLALGPIWGPIGVCGPRVRRDRRGAWPVAGSVRVRIGGRGHWPV